MQFHRNYELSKMWCIFVNFFFCEPSEFVVYLLTTLHTSIYNVYNFHGFECCYKHVHKLNKGNVAIKKTR